MKVCSTCKEEKPFSSFYCGSGYKDGYRGQCKDCCRTRENIRAALPENRRRKNEYHSHYREMNKDKISLRMKSYRHENRDKFSEYSRRYNNENPGAVTARQAKRRASKRNATPEWADLEKIKAMYKMAKNEGYHVDHIYPLQSDWVCGLHVHENLQVLDPIENMSKSNKPIGIPGGESWLA